MIMLRSSWAGLCGSMLRRGRAIDRCHRAALDRHFRGVWSDELSRLDSGAGDHPTCVPGPVVTSSTPAESRHCVDLPFVGNTFENMEATRLELDARAGDEILDGA